MQRRLAIALVLTALVSVLLVGFGVLAIAQAGARNRAEDDVTRALSVVGSLLGSDVRQLRQLEELIPANRRDLQLNQLSTVRIGDDGSIRPVGRGRGRPSASLDQPAGTLSPDDLARLDRDQTVLVSEQRVVVGVRLIPGVELPEGGGRLALLASQRVTAVPGQTVAWFLLSSLVVIVGALVAAILLARRLVRPIHEIQGATAAIAAGQLTTRVGAEGDDELAELGHSVNRMAADLERSKALDQQFLLSVSHDLRTPLTAIAGYAEALRDGALADPAGAGAVIGNHAERLERLVGDLLDLAKLDANRFRLDIREVDVAVVTGRTVAGLAAEAANHGIVIEQRIEAEPTIAADADRLAQVVGNLVDNALSFATASVLVEVAVEVPGEQADHATDAGPQARIQARVMVADDGPGFAEQDLPFVFDRLYTGSDRPRRAENSTGLGLSIVRELVGAMGGTVAAGNAPGGGAAIVIRFPLAGRPDLSQPDLSRAEPTPRPLDGHDHPPQARAWPEPRPPA